eukprot:TRINITY_DN2813_c1_g2_i1.p1 TRINITY_DN2813_c1_g2~~TRINITY_DN2813_c1_g2_i1.p1  ORF type:complete len:256 (+),score=107.64 TRINITY_DN2813_c1_g2_i1:93-860(+)
MVGSVYCLGLRATDNTPLMGHFTEFFATRLVKKGARRTNPYEDGSPELVACLEDFRGLVRDAAASAARGEPVACEFWESACEELSFKHVGVSHWVCPVRLAEYLEEQGLGVAWDGVMSDKRRVPPEEFLRKKVRKERGPAPAAAFHCAYCNVTCNSAAQMLVHTSGTRHGVVVAQLAKKHPDGVLAAPSAARNRRRRGRGSDKSSDQSSRGCGSSEEMSVSDSPPPLEAGDDEMYTTGELETLLESVVASLGIPA